jgi:sugar (pentulose or hexulose) kinase
MLAGIAAGVFASIEDAAGRMSRLERTFEPNRTLKAHYDEGFGRYTDLYARLKGFGGGESELLT